MAVRGMSPAAARVFGGIILVILAADGALGAFGVQGHWERSQRLGEDDFMSNVITAIETDSSGRIWVGTDKGLAWTLDDGRTWNFVNLAFARPRRQFGRGAEVGARTQPKAGRELTGSALLRRNSVTSICGGRHGVWVGTENGLCFGNEDVRTWDLFLPERGAPGPRIRSVVEFEGVVWVSGTNGLYRSADSGTNWKRLSRRLPPRVGFMAVTAEGKGRTCWLAGFNAPPRRGGAEDIFRTRDGGVTWQALRTGTASVVATLVSARVNQLKRIEGVLWACTRHGLARTGDGGETWTQVRVRPGLEAPEVFGIVTMSRWLWVATSEGLFSSRDEGKTWRQEGGLRCPVRKVLARKRHLWLATSGGLLRRTRGGDVRTFSVTSNVLSLALTTEYGSETWWAGTTGGLCFSRDGGGTWRVLTVGDGLPSNLILTLQSDGDRIWAGTDGGVWTGVDGGQMGRRYDRSHGLHGLHVRDIVVSDGTVLAATDRGLSLLAPKTHEWRTFLDDKAWHSICVLDGVLYGILRDPRRRAAGSLLIHGDPARENWRELVLPVQGRTHLHQIRAVADDLWVAGDRGLFRSTDEGLSWGRFGAESLWASRVTRLAPGPSSMLCVQAVPNDPPSPTAFLNVTRDCGRSWHVLPVAIPGHANVVMIAGDRVIVGTRDGLSSYAAFDRDLRPERSGWFTWNRIAALAAATRRTDQLGHVSVVDEHAFHGATLWLGSFGSGVVERAVPILDALRSPWDVTGETALSVIGFSMLCGEDVLAMVSSEKGMWFGTARGLFLYDRHDSWSFWAPAPKGLCGAPVRAITIRGEEVWVGTDQGLSLFDRGRDQWRTFRVERPVRPFDGEWHATSCLRDNRVTALACDGQRIWGGTERGGFVVARDGRWKMVLPEERIHAIALGSVREYFATERGVFAIDREAQTRRHLRKANTPLRENRVFQVFVDGPEVWAATRRGVRKILYDQAEPPAALRATSSRRDAEGVLIVANDNARQSVSIAEAYRSLRGIPAENVCHIRCPTTEVITRRRYERDIRDPVRRYLKEKGLSRKISFIVTTFGVPLRILPRRDSTVRLSAERDEASVDSELTLLARRHRVGGGLANPYLNREEAFDSTRFGMYLVTRLDGPTPEAAIGLARRAVSVESARAYGSRGFAFFDLYPRKDETAGRINAAIRSNYQVLRRQVRVHGRVRVPERTQLPYYRPGDCDNAFFFIGWGIGEYKPEVFSWVQGAVGVSLDRVTAPSARDTETSWVAGAIHDGITATMGTVADPGQEEYLSAGNLYRHLHAGFTWAEAAYMCTPHLSWQIVVFGDPLYRPLR